MPKNTSSENSTPTAPGVKSAAHRVVITGVGAVSPFGPGRETLTAALLAGQSGVRFLPELVGIPGIASHVAGVVPEIDARAIPRQFRRSMTKMSIYATLALLEAVHQAGYSTALDAADASRLAAAPLCPLPGDCALLLGSTMSSMEAWLSFSEKFLARQLESVKTTAVFQMMNHSPLANVAQALDLGGPGWGNCAACATGLMNVGLGFQLVRSGAVGMALCGGTDEYHPVITGCFSIMNAASAAFNDRPAEASRPFDARRGGIVCSEGCGMLVLETLESARARGAEIVAEIAGFGANTETRNIAQPSAGSIEQCMRLALRDAGLEPERVDFVNAHATGTLAGDGEECRAIGNVLGAHACVNSLKGHLGHTMAASGSLELIASLEMMRRGRFAKTLNLGEIAEDCRGVRHLGHDGKNAGSGSASPFAVELNARVLLKNSFALGGNNCTLAVKKWA